MLNAQEPLSAHDLGDQVVLIAEKQHLVRQILKDVLNKFGVRNFYEVSDSEVAFETFCEVVPGIVFTEWGPEFDGLSFLEKIRKDKKSPNQSANVIMVSANTELSKICAARDAGVTEFLVQPFSTKAIYDHMISAIAHPRRFIRIDDYVGPDRRRHNGEYDGEERRKDVQAPNQKPKEQSLNLGEANP